MSVDVRTRLDNMRLGAFHRHLIVVGGLGIMFDALDVGILSFVLAALILAWHLGPVTIGVMGSINLVGMAIGAAVAGSLADRYGRRTVFMWTLFLYSIATGVAGFATSALFLIVMRFIVGLGLGGELPVTTTLVAEFLPAGQRGRGIVWLESFWALGSLVAAVIAYFLIPVFTWRIGFFIGALPALYILYLRRGIPESPRYLWQAGARDEAALVTRMVRGERPASASRSPTSEGLPLRVLLNSAHRRTTVSLWLLWLMMNFAYYGMFLWLPSVLALRGMSLVHSFLYVLLVTLCEIPGYLSAAWLVERWGRRPVLLVYLLLAAGAATAFGLAQTPGQVLGFGMLLGFMNLGAWGATYAYTSEQYPTLLRARGNGFAMGVGRIGGVAGPILVGYLLAAKVGTMGIFGIFAAAQLVALVASALVGRETRGMTLEEIADEA